MNDVLLTRRLEQAQVGVLTTQQISVLLGMSVASATVRLNRLVKRGVLVRVMRGRYALPDTSVLSVASTIYDPSYVSLFAAFEYYGTTTQSPRIIDVITSQRSGKISVSLESGKYDIRFIKVTRPLLFGYKKVYSKGMAAMMAEKEKIVIDGLLFQELLSLDEVVACIRDGIEKEKVIEFANRTGRQTVKKRLGYLLAFEGIECIPEDFGKLSKTFVPLDPSLPRRGKHDKVWKVIVNGMIE